MYCHILQHNLLGQAYKQYRDKWALVQDNDPKHTSKVVTRLLEEFCPKKFDWPPGSPDLNPIENVWAVLKRNVAKKTQKNINELEAAIRTCWERLPDVVLENNIKSMKKIIQLVIESKGFPIKY